MKLCDVNVLVYAHRPDATEEHDQYATWLTQVATGTAAFGLSENVLSGFVRVVTNPKVFHNPTPVDEAFKFCQQLRQRPQACVLRPGERSWQIFERLCRELPAKGKLVADAWHAALAMEYDCEWISTDSDFSRFKNLKWQHPLR
ncbi:MAG: type II toxin-antitoxin system VapC family toxin [Verrucomicrobiota bacterium]